MSRQQPRDAEKSLDDQEEAQAQSAAGRAAIEQAARERDISREQFIDKLRDLGIPDEHDEKRIQQEFGPEMAGIYALANEDADDYRRHKWLNRNKRERKIASRNPGRLCSGPFLELARGQHNREESIQGEMTARERQKVREIFESKTAMHSLAKGAEGLSAVSEITAVTEHRRQTDAEDDDSSGGLVSRIFS